MPTRNVNLTDELDREERTHAAKLAVLRAAINDGDASGIAGGDVVQRIRERLSLPLTPQ